MKKTIRNCVIALFAITAMSCAQNVDEAPPVKEPVKEKVALTVETEFEMPMKNLAGLDFVVTVGNDAKTPVKVKATDTTIASSIGEYEVGAELNVIAKLSKDSKVLYEGEEKVTVEKGKNKIKVNLFPSSTSYLLWDSEHTPNKYQIYSDPLTGNETIGTNTIETSVRNYSINTKTGDIWIIDRENGSYDIHNDKETRNSFIKKYSYITGEIKLIKSLGLYDEDTFAPSITTFYDEKKQCDVVLFAENKDDVKVLKYFYEDGSKEGEITVEPTLSKAITAMTFVGDDLYYADFEKGSDKNGNISFSCGKATVNKMKNLKQLIINSSNSAITVTSEKIPIDESLKLKEVKVNLEGTEETLSSALKILDIKSIGNDLYLTGTDLGDTCKGEILKLNLLNNKVSTYFLYEVPDLATSITEIYVQLENVSKQLLGARKILALTPKKLVFLDRGNCVYLDDQQKYMSKDLKRVVTVNLQNYTLKSVELDKIPFAIEISSGFEKARF